MSDLPNCKTCGRRLTKSILAAKRRAKVQNALNSRAKALARGNKLGRKIKHHVDQNSIHTMRFVNGWSLRKIAKEIGVSTTTVQRILKR